MTIKISYLWVTIIAISLASGLGGCMQSASSRSRVLIEYHRSGGFVGLDDRLIIREDGETSLTRKERRFSFTLDRATVNQLADLFTTAGFMQLRKEYMPQRAGPDLFTYVVTYRGHTVRTMDGAIPPALDPILEQLDQIVESHQ
ncbi:MAG: hypothetical protein RMK84_13210 [Oscillochloridaceae bacterium]|nr:hypothetical protein [Chloroflexaceae bacterium]MDW8391079.1 hypothetical protein [Oscillochloridaceae bacterium]